MSAHRQRSVQLCSTFKSRAGPVKVFRLEFGFEQLAQGVESGAARAAQRCRVIAHEASVQKSRLKPTPVWRCGL
jgi:hypothetical protein